MGVALKQQRPFLKKALRAANKKSPLTSLGGFLAAPPSRKLFLKKIISGNLSPPPRRRNHFRFPVRTFVQELTRKSRANLILT